MGILHINNTSGIVMSHHLHKKTICYGMCTFNEFLSNLNLILVNWKTCQTFPFATKICCHLFGILVFWVLKSQTKESGIKDSKTQKCYFRYFKLQIANRKTLFWTVVARNCENMLLFFRVTSAASVSCSWKCISHHNISCSAKIQQIPEQKDASVERLGNLEFLFCCL